MVSPQISFCNLGSALFLLLPHTWTILSLSSPPGSFAPASCFLRYPLLHLLVPSIFHDSCILVPPPRPALDSSFVASWLFSLSGSGLPPPLRFFAPASSFLGRSFATASGSFFLAIYIPNACILSPGYSTCFLACFSWHELSRIPDSCALLLTPGSCSVKVKEKVYPPTPRKCACCIQL